jgi:hypothetical protein
MLYIHCGPFAPGSAHSRDPKDWRPILRNIKSLELTFHDGRLWQRAWNSREARRLPQAARIAFTIDDESGRTHSYRTMVPIVCHTTAKQRESRKPAGQP